MWSKWAESVNTCLASFEKKKKSLHHLPSSLSESSLTSTPHLHLYRITFLLHAFEPKGEYKSWDVKAMGVEEDTQPSEPNRRNVMGGGKEAGCILCGWEGRHDPFLNKSRGQKTCHQTLKQPCIVPPVPQVLLSVSSSNLFISQPPLSPFMLH